MQSEMEKAQFLKSIIDLNSMALEKSPKKS